MTGPNIPLPAMTTDHPAQFRLVDTSTGQSWEAAPDATGHYVWRPYVPPVVRGAARLQNHTLEAAMSRVTEAVESAADCALSEHDRNLMITAGEVLVMVLRSQRLAEHDPTE